MLSSKKLVYVKLVTEVNSVDLKIPITSGLITKIQCDLEKQNLGKNIKYFDKNIPNTSGLVQKTDYNTEITDIENKIHSANGLVTTTSLNIKGIKIPNN